MVLGGGASRELLDHGGGGGEAFIREISALIRAAPEIFLPLAPYENTV